MVSRSRIRKLEREASEARADMLRSLTDWVGDGSTLIGVFENVALDSAALGHRVAFPFDDALDERLVIGQTRAPDCRQFIGWKYILKAKTRDPEVALALVLREPEVQDAETV